MARSEPTGRRTSATCPPTAEEADPAPPRWATRSTSEDGGVTHERLSPLHPVVTASWPGARATARHPTDVTLSAVDRPTPGGWRRLPVTVQIEGGSYTLAAARQLRRALDELISAAEVSGDGCGPTPRG